MFGEETTTRLQGLVVAKVLLYILVDIATNSTQPVSCYSRVFFRLKRASHTLSPFPIPKCVKSATTTGQRVPKEIGNKLCNGRCTASTVARSRLSRNSASVAYWLPERTACLRTHPVPAFVPRLAGETLERRAHWSIARH